MGELAINYQLSNVFLRKVSIFRWYMTMGSNLVTYRTKVRDWIERKYNEGVAWIKAKVPEDEKEKKMAKWLDVRIDCLEKMEDASDVVQTICDFCYNNGFAPNDVRKLLLQCLHELRFPAVPECETIDK
uniref:Uncharacterized protein n=1 Tax=Clandestinovirus TaxID=2831644 RepID=A0A8F8PJY8_9VIRU|nr:hypothetical protein KOM_12_189 [Clandestinovirus]